MKKSGRILWAILATLLLGGCLYGAFMLYFALFSPQVHPQVIVKLEEIDRYLARGYFDLARQELLSLYRKADSNYTLLRILKRMVNLTRHTGEWQWLNTYTSQAYRSRPGNKDLAFLAAYTAYQARRLDEVQAIIRKKPLPPPLTSLALATLLTLESGTEQLETLRQTVSEEERDLISLIHAPDPLLLEALGIKEQEKRLILDAALLWMARGEVGRAFALVKEQLAENAFDEPVAAISYEAGDFERARQRLNALFDREKQRTDLLLFIADTWLLEKNYAEAKLYYQLVVNNIPSLTSHPFLNLAWILQQEGRDEEALSVLKQGLTIFPREGMLVRELAKLKIRTGYEHEAVPLLQAYLNNEPDNAEAWFMLLSLESKRLQPDYFLARLWQLFERYPANDDLCEYLVWHLLKLKDYQRAGMALDIYANACLVDRLKQPAEQLQVTRVPANTASGVKAQVPEQQLGGEALQRGWFLHLTGLLAALRGEYSAAVEKINRSLLIEEALHVRYNRAVLHKYLKNYIKAKEDIQQVLVDFRLTGEVDEKKEKMFFAKLHTLRGELLYNEGAYENARAAWLYALDYYPENAEAKFLLNKLEKTK